MIDLHNHVLPNVDDGSKSLEMSLEMLKHAELQGITDVVNTVHYQHPKVEGKEITYEKIIDKIKLLESHLRIEEIEIKLHLGSEVFYIPNLLDFVKDPLATFGHGKYMLIEFHPGNIPKSNFQQLFDLKMAGVCPIIAHPERYIQVQENLNIILDWLNLGCLIQIDAGSILGKFGKRAFKCSRIMIDRSWCHIIGSDSHNNTSRTFCLKKAIDLIKPKLGNENIRKMVYEHPKAVLLGEPIPIEFEFHDKNVGIFEKIIKRFKMQ